MNDELVERCRRDGWCEKGIAWLLALPDAVDRWAVVESMTPALNAYHLVDG